jgi:hypothetical protein
MIREIERRIFERITEGLELLPRVPKPQGRGVGWDPHFRVGGVAVLQFPLHTCLEKIL